ncbi:MAG TPA: OmpA family protein [Bacteroidia bacterium]|jgi:outer membrane protein OmpA-like peptidoglycan-associated protein|nr:OmpA family protein [Bacteroidia bacterium]
MLRLAPIKISLFIFLCVQCLGAFAQTAGSPNDTTCGKTDNSKAVDLYTKGTDKKKYQKQERLTFLKQAIALEPDYVAANFAMGQEIIKSAYADNTPFDPAVPYFQTVIKNCPHYHSDPYYFVGISAFEANAYDQAVIYLQKYIDYKDDDVKKFSKDYDSYSYDAKQKLKASKFYLNLFTSKVPFDPHMVKGLCTDYNEYLAFISPDNQLAFFTRRMPYHNNFSSTQSEENMKEYFMMSQRKEDGTFEAGSPMPPPFNRGLNEGGPTITIDNKHLFFTICKPSADGGSSCQVYFSDYTNGAWGEIKNLGQQVNDPSAWNSQPSIASDGQTLYFSSNRPGGMGKCDLYKTIKDASGDWGPAVNLGPGINTAGNEKSPFIHTDSHTLYFSSDGWPGVGGFDIFYSRMDTSGKWSEPKNIGYPINSNQDEVGFFVSTDGKTGYFCSNDPNRTNGENMGGYDIYQFPLYQEARPEKVSLLTGKIKDDAGNPITGATITITDTKTHKTAAVISDTVNASFAAVVNESQNQQYVATVTKKGYAFNSGIITSKDTFTGKPKNMDFNMKTLASGGNYVLNDIYYKTSSAQLETVSLAVVKEFAKYMKLNPTIKVKIAGYTDNVGSEQANQSLSSDRAFTVMQALTKEGIKGERLSFQGYGAANPVASNDTEEGRQKNRRTEFIIIQK